MKFRAYTSNNQRLWSAFDDLDSKLSLFCDVTRSCKKLCGGCQTCIPRSIDPRQVPVSTQIRIRSAFFLRRTQLARITYISRTSQHGALSTQMIEPNIKADFVNFSETLRIAKLLKHLLEWDEVHTYDRS